MGTYRLRSRILFAAMTMLLAACDREVGEGPILGVVYGVITRASGDPVAGATVTLWPLDRASCSQPGPVSVDSAKTKTTGDFRVEQWSFGGARRPFSYAACAQLLVRFPRDLALRDTTLDSIKYRMYFGPPDSTRIDIRLPE
jgi:hypothetical protein